jgi:hypothetical protein
MIIILSIIIIIDISKHSVFQETVSRDFLYVWFFASKPVSQHPD